MSIVSKSPLATKEIGEKLGILLRGGETVCLYGDVGAGKTCLAQGIIRGAGVMGEEYPRSPTFSIINRYVGRFIVHHLDLYRLNTRQELIETGVEELLDREGETRVIEWPERLSSLPLPDRIDIDIRIVDENSREIEFSAKNHPQREIVLKLGEGSNSS